MTATRSTSWLSLLVWAISFVCMPAFAEENPIKIPDEWFKAPEVTPSQAPPPKEDRAKSSAAAKAAALGGAGQSKVMCYMMMSEAMGETDKTAKAMMMMAAQQACKQGDEMMKSAFENDKGQKLVTQNDIPKQSELKTSSIKFLDGPKDVNMLDGKAKSSESSTDSDTSQVQDFSVAKYEVPDVLNKQAPPPAQDQPPPQTAPTKGPLDLGQKTLTPVAETKIGFDQNGKQNNLGPGPTSGVANGGVNINNSKGLSEAEIKRLVAEGGVAKTKKARRGAKETNGGESGDSGGGGGGGSSSEGRDDGLSAMLAQLMGGGPGGEGGFAGVPVDVIELPGPKKKPQPNIFQYATYRYQKAGLEEKKVTIRHKQKRSESAKALKDSASKIAQATKP